VAEALADRVRAPADLLRRLAAVCLCLLALAGTPALAGEKIHVLAAESLREAVDEAAAAYRQAAGVQIAAVFGHAPKLAERIEAGGRADILITSSREALDRLDAKGLLRPDSRTELLGTWLVLVAPKDSVLSLRIAPGFPLAGALGTRRLAIPDVEKLPAGRTAKAALEHLGVWDGIKDQLMPAPGVRAALRLVATGEAPLGIVYVTDALVEPRVKVVDAFPEESHPPIVYSAALTGSAGPDAEGFFDFLKSVEARAIFEKRGFTVLDR
jgi:molybdate transport system substrate-binding protein